MNQNYCTTDGCGCPVPKPQPCQTEPEPRCGCADDFRTLLGIVCGPQLRGLVDFASFGFITDSYLLGTTLIDPCVGTTPGDNLDLLAGTYVCGTAGCDTIAVCGTVAPAVVGATPVILPVTQVALCRLDALVFSVTTPLDTNFQTVTQTLSQLMEPRKTTCCDSVAGSLLGAAAARTATVTAGPLAVYNAVVLGTFGDVLVLANSVDGRIYFICAEKIAFIG